VTEETAVVEPVVEAIAEFAEEVVAAEEPAAEAIMETAAAIEEVPANEVIAMQEIVAELVEQTVAAQVEPAVMAEEEAVAPAVVSNGINLKNANVWNELGNIFARSNAYEDAVDAYNHAIELNPEFGWSYANLGLVYARQGKRDDAMSLYQKSLELLWTDTDKAYVWNRLGDVYRQAGKYNEAIEAYQTADRHSQEALAVAPEVVNVEQLFTHFVS